MNKTSKFVLKTLEKEQSTKFLPLEQITETIVALYLFLRVPIKDYCNMELQFLCELFRDYQKKLWNGVHQEEENDVDLNVPGRTGLEDW